MICSKCGIAMRIQSVKTEVKGDTDADTPTRVFTVQTLACRNKKCAAYGQAVAEVRTLLFDGAEQPEAK